MTFKYLTIASFALTAVLMTTTACSDKTTHQNSIQSVNDNPANRELNLAVENVVVDKALDATYDIALQSKQGIMEEDIIFQTSLSSQSKAIQLATDSKYSHMGIIYKQGNDFVVLEAIQPVKLTPLSDWIQRGKNQHYVIKRLQNADEVLTDSTLDKMKAIGNGLLGKSYDIYFEWSDDKIYCSELVWKIYKEGANIEIGNLETLSDFDLSNELVTAKMTERFGNNIPMNEIVISPATMFNSKKLITVAEQ